MAQLLEKELVLKIQDLIVHYHTDESIVILR